jgi:hypothetical protein
MPVHQYDLPIRRFMRRLLAVITLKYALTYITVWCFVWGIIALSMRVITGSPRITLLWGAIGSLLAVLAALLVSRKRLPAHSAVRALLDQRNECGGLLMAEEDLTIGFWQSRISAINIPRVRWRSSRALVLFAASISFVIITLFVPVRFAGMNGSHSLDVTREVSDLTEKVERLKEEQIIDKAEAEALEQTLDQLGKEAQGEDPVRTLEALDHVAEKVKKEAGEAVESIAGSQEKLSRAETLAEGLMTGANQIDPRLMTEAMQTLSAMMQSAIQENQMLASALSPQLQEAIKSGAIKPEQLKEIAKVLSNNRSAVNQRLSKLNKAGLVNSSSLKAGVGATVPDSSGLAQFLKENAQQMSVEDAVAAWCEKPGKGGVGRGRGDAEMTWTDETSEKDARFKEKELPPSALAGLKESQMVGISAAAPTVENQVAAHGALNNANQGGGSAYTQSILPRHRGAVKRYFERPQNRQ